MSGARRRATGLAAVLLALAASGCAPAGEPEGAERVEAAELGIAVARLPAACQPEEAAGLRLELTCALDGSQGTLTIEAGGPADHNLLELANAQRQDFEALPEGRYFGNRELVTPTGTAYTARGRYLEDGRAVEVTRVLAWHPSQNRPLIFNFRYPEGDDTQRRVDQLLLVVGEVEALGAAPG